jgi:hypothetical protein
VILEKPSSLVSQRISSALTIKFINCRSSFLAFEIRVSAIKEELFSSKKRKNENQIKLGCIRISMA